MVKGVKKIFVLFTILLPFKLFGEVPIFQQPKIIFAPKRTGRLKAVIKGQTCSNCTVRAKIGEKVFTGKADKVGLFEIEVGLFKNQENVFTIWGEKGRRKSPPVQISILQYEIPLPEPNSPPNVDLDAIPRYTNEPGILVFGRALPKVKVIAEGGSAKAEGFSDENGFFELLVFLKFDELNEIDIYYQDEKGFVSPKATFRIYQISKAPPAPKLENVPKFTNFEKIKIKGVTVPGFSVVVELPTGRKIESKADDESGKFEVDVPLIINSENKLSFYTVDLAGNFSAPERVVIFQDIVPPPPPEIYFYPSQVYQDRVTVIGKGEPETEVIAQILANEYEVGEVDKSGNFVVSVPVLKYARQIRRNYINIYLKDRAGNLSQPTLIVVDVLPDIRLTNLGLNFGVHSFLGIMSQEFFNSINKRPFDFVGLSVELRYTRIFQRRSGPAFTLVGGFTLSSSKKVDIQYTPDTKVVGDPNEVSRLSLSTLYIVPTIGLAIFFENFDVIPSVGAGVLGFIKNGPTVEVTSEGRTILKESRFFLSYTVRTDIVIRYSVTKDLSLYLTSAISSSPVRNVNEEGDSVDAGGVLLGFGLVFGF